jgi:hypothetical protein
MAAMASMFWSLITGKKGIFEKPVQPWQATLQKLP